MKIKKLLIANRGEIAARIARTAGKLGIEVVCLLHELPRYLEDICTIFEPLPDSKLDYYLDQRFLIEVAKKHQCDAIHPGYGFLSENASFAKLVKESGIIWVGPNSNVIEKMGDKDTARGVVKGLGGPLLGSDESFDPNAKKIEAPKSPQGLPWLIKAAHGGGGKGMRIVHRAEEIAEAVERAKSESLKSFGSDKLIVERFLGCARHVEVQVLGDQHGNIKIIGDRDCSLQRRHQKVIEEAPAFGLHPETRKKLHGISHKIAKEVGYESAGTIEFLVDWTESKRETEQDFFFLEMNTRLQVEHPVSEEVFGVDLVEWQIRVACGESLESLEVSAGHGHSLEARIYAENPALGFLPVAGSIDFFEPYQEAGVRWEVGIDRQAEITSDFDPMIAKLVVKDIHRGAAYEKLSQVLQKTVLAGIATNQNFLIQLASDPKVLAGDISTTYIETEKPHEKELSVLSDSDVDAVMSQIHDWCLGSKRKPSRNAQLQSVFTKSPYDSPLNVLDWQYTSTSSQSIYWGRCQVQGQVATWVFLDKVGEDSELRLSARGQAWIKVISQTIVSGGASGAGVSSGDVLSAVPGKVVKVLCEAGQKVEEGTKLFVLESMKMEFDIYSPKAGEVATILVHAGEQIDAEQRLLEWLQDDDT